MGLTKQYLRYVPSAAFGIVGSSKANIVTVDVNGQTGKFAAVTAVENVLIWDLKKGEIVRFILILLEYVNNANCCLCAHCAVYICKLFLCKLSQ